ncbi:MAG: hypothetical protein HYY00_00305 [Chloroflexi bacterium]|nr:hypothetical protein [Chloroflexota bacterium]
MLEDFNVEKVRLEDTQRAVLNILDDFDTEKGQLERTQRATFNVLEDFNAEKVRLEDTQRAVLNILDDFDVEKTKVEQANLMLEAKSEELNRSNAELHRAHAVLELRVQERTAELQQSNAQLRAEMEERKKAEDETRKSLREKEVLLKEVHHRVKNNLQIIHSMLNLQLPRVKDQHTIETFKESQNRIYTMALIHEKLYQSESLATIDLPEYIRSLIANLFLTYGVTERVMRPQVHIENVNLDVDTLIPCALIINELVTNSLKYAFPDPWRGAGRTAEIRIGLHQDGANSFILTVSDNGVGLPAGFRIEECETLGLRLVSVLTKQLRGTLGISTSAGTELTIAFQVAR